MYDTFLDESLNMLLRSVAAAAHRRTMYKRIFVSFDLHGFIVDSSFMFGSIDTYESDDDE